MKRLMVIALALSGALILSACGGEATPSGANGGASPTTGASNSAGAVSPGASGIKDAALLGKWITADGGSGYDFKDDYSVVITMVGNQMQSSYNIVEGGSGQGKVEIGEQAGVIVWTYKIDGEKMEFTADGGRAKRLSKTQ